MPNSPFRLFGIEITRTTDILAFASFVISLASFLIASIAAAFQFAAFTAGAKVTFFPPRQVLIARDDLASGPIVIIVAQMGYVNSGQAGYNSVILAESVEFQIGKSSYELQWHEFVTTRDVSGKPGEYSMVKQEDAGIFTLDAGRTVAHETQFVPYPIECEPTADCNIRWNYLTPAQFVNLVEGSPPSSSHRGAVQLVFKFRAKQLDKSDLTGLCKVVIPQDSLRRVLEKEKSKAWTAPTCHDANDKGSARWPADMITF